MSAPTTSIEWTEASWNPVRGCSIVSPGCKNCYAMKLAHRFSGFRGSYEGLTRDSHGGPVWTGKISLVHRSLEEPLHWRKPKRIFVNSMSDLFHEDVPDSYIDRVFAVMAEAERHTFQILTKRARRMFEYMSNPERPTLVSLAMNRGIRPFKWPLPNVWLGVSVEDQARAEERIPDLLGAPARVRWISAEPLLERVSLRNIKGQTIEMEGSPLDHFDALHPRLLPARLDWVVVGGESGRKSRRFYLSWAQAIVDDCRAAGVPVFVKQLGSRAIAGLDPVTIGIRFLDQKGGDPDEWPIPLRVREYPAIS